MTNAEAKAIYEIVDKLNLLLNALVKMAFENTDIKDKTPLYGGEK